MATKKNGSTPADDGGGTGLMLKASEGGSISRPTTPASRLQGSDQDDLILPRIHIFQGLPEERKRYGDFKPGDFIDTLTMETVAARNFSPIFGYKQWIKWSPQRGEGMVYSHRDKGAVPPEDLEWNEAATDPKDKPPKAQEYINWVVLFEGETSPHVLSFTKTSIKAGRTINTLEKMRGAKGAGFYGVELKEKQNSKGTWLSPQIRPAGDPPASVSTLVEEYYNSLSGQQVETNMDGTQFDPDAH